MAGSKLLKIRVSLKGRPIKTYKFNQDVISVGRNPEADIFLDNQGISRDHLKLEMTARGYYAVEDLGSANGTFLNDQQVEREFLMNNDVVRVGKFSLWATYEEDKRGNEGDGKHLTPTAFEGTTVLSTEELQGMMEAAKVVDAEPPPDPEPKPVAPKGPVMNRSAAVALIALSFVLGGSLGAGVMWMLLQ